MEFLELAFVRDHVRAGADHAHVAKEHVDELRKLIHAEAPQPSAAAVNALVAAAGLTRFVVVFHMHGAELEDLEDLPVFADARLAVEERAGGIEALDGPDDGHERQDDGRNDDRADRDVEDPFDRAIVGDGEGQGRR